MPLVANRVACADALQANRGANVASENFADLFPLVGMHLQQPPNALTPATARVQNRISGLELARVNPNKRQLADERVSHDFESQRRERLFVVGFAKNLLPVVGIQAMRFGNVERRRQIIYDRIQQRLYPLVLERRPYYNRKYLQRNGRLAQRGAQLVRRNLFAFKKFVQDFVVVLGNALD